MRVSLLLARMRARTLVLGLVLLSLVTIVVPAEEILPVGTAVATACDYLEGEVEPQCVVDRVRCLRWCM